MRIVVRAAVATLLAAVTSSAFADYTFTDLTPPGSSVAQAVAVASGQQGGVADPSGNQHAILWTGSAPGTDLNPAGANSSQILALSTTQAVGYMSDGTGLHAGIWTPANATPFALLPASTYINTQATGISGSIISGLGTTPGPSGAEHALIWTSPTATPTDLHNFVGVGAAYDSSDAEGTDGNRVVGNATPASTVNPHAALWNITTATFTDLHTSTTGFQNSQAVSVAGNQVVGFGLTNTDNATTHAILWTLSGVNDVNIVATDLNPAGFLASVASATNGSLIVGYASGADQNDHAIVWTSPTSFVDLSTFLPAGEFVSSEAYGIDANGDIVGDATDTDDGITHAILWTPESESVPEPGSLALLSLPAMLLFRRRRGDGR